MLTKPSHPDRVGHPGEDFRVIAERRLKEIHAAYHNLMG